MAEIVNAGTRRYERQIGLPEVGTKGQKKLQQARVAVVGVGGLGSPVSVYLACAGIGHLTLIDSDVVDETNLNRQILHWEQDVGRRKIESALSKLKAMNSSIQLIGKDERLDSLNVERLLGGADLIIDCLDNFETRYILNEFAVTSKIPFVHGACQGFEGRITTIIPGMTACLRCLIPEPPPSQKVPVMGMTPGFIAMMQANEAVKFFLKHGNLLTNTLFIYDGMTLTFRKIELAQDPDCPCCGKGKKT